MGIAQNQAHWPSVFDFEDIGLGPDRPRLRQARDPGAKIRILPRIFDQPSLEDDSLQFQEFEYSLNLWST